MIHGKLSKWQSKVIIIFKGNQTVVQERKSGLIVNDSNANPEYDCIQYQCCVCAREREWEKEKDMA